MANRLTKTGAVLAGASLIAACNLPPEEITTPTDYPVPSMKSVGETPSSTPGQDPDPSTLRYACIGAVFLKGPRTLIVDPIMDMNAKARGGMAPTDFRPRFDSATKVYTFELLPSQAVEADDMVLFDKDGKDTGNTPLPCSSLGEYRAVAIEPLGDDPERLVITKNPTIQAKQIVDLGTPAAAEESGVLSQEFAVPLYGEPDALKRLTDNMGSN